MDLYATESQTFWRITFPLVFPGILGAALLSFSLSFDDFIITNLNAGNTTTFPMYVWGVGPARRPDAGQRRRHGDVRDLDRDRARCRAATAGGRRRRSPDELRRDPGAALRSRTPSPTPYWLDDPARPDAAARRSTGRPRPTSSSSAAATSGCGPRCWPRSATPSRDVRAARGRPLRRRGERAQRRLLRGQPDPRLRQRPGALARRAATLLTGWATRTSTAIERTVARARHRLRLRQRPASLAVATRPHQVAGLREEADEMRAHGHRRRPGSTPTDAARAGGLADLPRRRARPRGGDRRAGPAGLGAARGLPATSACAIAEGTPVDRAGAASAPGWPCDTRGGSGARRPGRARHQRVPAAAAPAAADDGAGLRLRADDRAADRRRSARRSAGAAARGSATRATSSTTSAPTRDGRILWGGYDAIYHYGSGIRPRVRRSAPRPSRCWPQHFFTTFPQLAGLRFTPRVGRRDRHLHPVQPPSTARRTRGRVGLRPRLHRPRRRRHPLRRRRRARPARRRGHRAHRGWRWCARSRCRSRPSRSAGSASRRPAGRWPAPTQRRQGEPLARTMDRLGLGFDS